MSAEDQTYRLLAELGLNEYETRAYLSVLEGGILVAREVSDRAAIPYAKVYQTLNDLIDKQLITGDEGRPKKFQARHPEAAIKDRLKKLEEDWQKAHEKRKELLMSILPELLSLFSESNIDQEEVQGVWNITGLTNIVSRLSTLLTNATNSILIVTGDYQSFSDNIEKHLTNSKIPLKLIADQDPKLAIYQQVVTKPSLGQASTILVDDLAMITIAEIQKGKYSAGEYTAVLTQIRELVSSARSTFEGMMR